MSTLNVANISDDQSTLSNSANPSDALNNTTTVDTKFVTNGCAKVWSNQQGDGSLVNSLNVTSVTDLETGSNQINITNNFVNTDYVVLATGTTKSDAVIAMFQTVLVDSFKINTRDAATTSINSATRSACFGDLA